MEQSSFGYWLRLKRKALDLTREGLAERVGYSAATIRKIEDEERHPSTQIIERLAEIFRIPANERIAFIRFARGDRWFAPGETKENSPWQASAKSPRSNLPATITSLIGREKEIALVREYLSSDEIRLVTLVGPPGIGKTRLSIEAAHVSLPDFPDGVFFVALASLDNATLITQIVSQSLGYVEANNRSTSEQLKEGISEKKILLVVDNCEHLIDGIALLASDLLSACSRLKILTTSRESLRITGEWLYPVPAFDFPEEISSIDVESAPIYPALTLFAERARAVRPDFVLDTENIKTVAAICAHLDGLPLAIELIAARMRLMSPQALLERLNNQFILSADGMRASSPRQKTLNDAIGWSYRLLPPEEQKLFVYLSVFSGGFTLEAAGSIFSGMFTARSVSDLITSLLDKSLLQRAFDARDETRFDMLLTIQEFARARLRGLGEEAEIRNLHLAYFVDLAEKGDREIRGPNQIEWLYRLSIMRDNFRAALQWVIEMGQVEAALHLARKLSWFWFMDAEFNEARQWLGRVVALPEAPLYPDLYAEALTHLAHHAWHQIGAKQARPFAERALSVAHAHADKWNTARALMVLGLVMNQEHNFAAAQSTLEESKTLFQEVHDDWGYGHAMMGLGARAFLQSDDANTLALHEQALAQFRQLGDRYFQSVALRFIGYVHVRQGNWLVAQNALREALILAKELGSTWEVAAVLWGLTDAVQGAGDYARAVRLNWAAKNIFKLVGAWKQEDESMFEEVLASCRAALGESEFAAALEEGRAMTMEQAIAYALETADG